MSNRGERGRKTSLGTRSPTKKMERVLCLLGGESPDGSGPYLVAGGPRGSSNWRVGDLGRSLVEVGDVWNETKIERKIPHGHGVFYPETVYESGGGHYLYLKNRDSTNG